MKTIGYNIKLARWKQQLTQSELAAKAEISRTYLSMIERGKSNPSIMLVATLAKLLHCTVDELLAEDAPDKAHEQKGA